MKKMEKIQGLQEDKTFVDVLKERRTTSDVMWMFRPLNPVSPYKLPSALQYTKEQTIEAVLANPRVILLIDRIGSAKKIPVQDVIKEARAILDEMAGAPQLPTIRCLGLLVTKALKRILKGVLVNQNFLLELKEKMRDDGVQYVYVPSHRSYLDFVLLSYILFSNDMAIPNIASGMDFYKMRVVGELLRRSGAFYMRRSFATDPLYKEIFRAYISCLVAHSERAIEFFIEGTRSRSQKSLAPKYGLLAMILEGLWKADVPDIRFIPLSITYDRPLEEILFVYELLGVPKPPESTTGLFKSLSVLHDASAYGNAYVKIAPAISARQFLDHDTLRKSALSPHSKLPSDPVKELAYAIINSHKSHTPLSPFNLIALLFNERVYSHPREPYVIETLITDYCWLKEFFSHVLKATVYPGKNEPGNNVKDDVRTEVLEALFTHRALLTFDSNGKLVLVERHRDSQICDPRKVKGHLLSERTMRVAVPSINITTYTNPSMAFLAKPAFVAVCIIKSGLTKESVFMRYTLLRELLGTEFALVPGKSVSEAEWEEGLSLLMAEDCIRLENNLLVMGSNVRLFSLLQNLLLPFVAASYITCTVLHQWSDEMGEATDSNVLKTTQKQAELLLLECKGMFRYPYFLSLDLYASTLISLGSMGIVTTFGRSPHTTYTSDEIRLGKLIIELECFNILSASGSYLEIRLLPAVQAPVIRHSKL